MYQICVLANRVCKQDLADRHGALADDLNQTHFDWSQNTVRSRMLHVLGVVAEFFPLVVTGKDSVILSIFLANLKTEARTG